MQKCHLKTSEVDGEKKLPSPEVHPIRWTNKPSPGNHAN